MTIAHWAKCSCQTECMYNLQFSRQLYEADMDATVAEKETDRWSNSPKATQLVNGRSGCTSCPSNFTSWALSLSGDDEKIGNQVLMRCRANPRSLATPKLSLLPGQLSPWQQFTASSKAPSSLFWYGTEKRCCAVHHSWAHRKTTFPSLLCWYPETCNQMLANRSCQKWLKPFPGHYFGHTGGPMLGWHCYKMKVG